MSCLSDKEIKTLISPLKHISTKGFQIACPQLHVFDIKASLHFYCNILGMKLLKKLDFPGPEFSDYFLGYIDDNEQVPTKGSPEATIWAMTKPRTVDLRYNWKNNAPYEVGSGFSNLSILVPDVYSSSKRLEELGVNFIKKPAEGGFAGLALIQDPDGYTVELYSIQTIKDHCL